MKVKRKIQKIDFDTKSLLEQIPIAAKFENLRGAQCEALQKKYNDFQKKKTAFDNMIMATDWKDLKSDCTPSVLKEKLSDFVKHSDDIDAIEKARVVLLKRARVI